MTAMSAIWYALMTAKVIERVYLLKSGILIMNLTKIIFYAGLCLLLTGFFNGSMAGESSDSERGKLKILFVSISPQKFFTEKIAGDDYQIEVMLPAGQSPATYDPTPLQMGRLGEAKAFMAVGVAFERRLLENIKDNYRDLMIVDTREGVALKPIEHEEEAMESDHEHGRFDPHIWLDPMLVKIQAGNIKKALAQLEPTRAAVYEANYIKFCSELDSLNNVLTQILKPYEGQTIYVFHPAYGYFTDAYHLIQKSVEIAGKEPSARQLSSLVETAQKERVKALFVQPQFSRKTAKTIAREIGGEVITLDPLAENYYDNLTDIAHKIAEALSR